MNYKEEYNVFWNGNNRFGEKSFVSAEKVVSEIISVFGRGSVLDIGSGRGVYCVYDTIGGLSEVGFGI